MEKEEEVWEEIDSWLWIPTWDNCIKCGREFPIHHSLVSITQLSKYNNSHCPECMDKYHKHLNYWRKRASKREE